MKFSIFYTTKPREHLKLPRNSWEIQDAQRLLRSDLSGTRAVTATPPPANRDAANYLIEMSKSKVVATRNLVHEAQRLLEARADQFEIVQWQSDLVSDIASLHVGMQGANANC
jgi:hypothetical protein